jgi:hypothetical protein
MSNEKPRPIAERPLPAGPVAGALGLALLGAALLRYWRQRRGRS